MFAGTSDFQMKTKRKDKDLWINQSKILAIKKGLHRFISFAPFYGIILVNMV